MTVRLISERFDLKKSSFLKHEESGVVLATLKLKPTEVRTLARNIRRYSIFRYLSATKKFYTLIFIQNLVAKTLNRFVVDWTNQLRVNLVKMQTRLLKNKHDNLEFDLIELNVLPARPTPSLVLPIAPNHRSRVKQ